MPRGELDVLQPAGDLADRVGQHLAVLGGDDRGQVVGPLVQQLAEREEHRGPLGQRRTAPLAGGLARRGDGGLDLLGATARSTSAVCSPVAGL